MPPQAPITVPLNISAPVTFAAGTPNSQTLSIVQTAPLNTGASPTITFTKPTTAGNCIVVLINAYNTTDLDVPSVSGVTLDGLTDNFVTAGPAAVSGYIGAALYTLSAIWIDPNCAGGHTVVTISGANLTFNGYQLQAYEVAGVLAIGSPVDRYASAVATVGGTAWSSGATAGTRFANEIWFGTNQSGSVVTFPNFPWVTQPPAASALGGGGYQIVAAEGAATFAGTQASADGWSAAVVTLIAGAQTVGTAKIGPIHQKEVWYPQVISVSATTAVKNAVCQVYTGPDTSQPNFVWSTPNGSSGDSTANIAGPGLTAANLPGRLVHCNEYIWAIWTGGDLGAQGRVNIQGMKVLNSGGPPAWQHARIRPGA